MITNPNLPGLDSKYMEIVGTVMDSQTLQEVEHASFGDSFGEWAACRW